LSFASKRDEAVTTDLLVQDPRWARSLFVTLLVLAVGLALWGSRLNPTPIYDEPEHLKDLAIFAKSGWSQETFQKKYNYAATVCYWLPSRFYKEWPTLQTLRWYSLATMATGLWLSAVLFRRWTGSWLPGAALVACPHVILCMMTYMTEGTALLFIAVGLLLLDRALRARGGAEWVWTIAGGLSLGLGIVSRQIWVVVLGGLALAVWLSFFREDLAKLRRVSAFGGLVALALMAAVVLDTGGMFTGGGGRLQTQVRLSRGNWLLSLLAFLPVYGLGTWMALKRMRGGGVTRPWVAGVSVLVAGVLTLTVVSLDSPHAWMGNGPINRVLQGTGLDWFKPLGLFLLAASGLCLLIEFGRDVAGDRRRPFNEIFACGSLASTAVLFVFLSFPTPFYERYVLTSFFCALAGCTLTGQVRAWPWLIQIGLLLLFQAGVLGAKGLFLVAP
jgi:hypothetical protein